MGYPEGIGGKALEMGHRTCSVSWLDHLDKAGQTDHHRALKSSATSNQDPRSATEG